MKEFHCPTAVYNTSAVIEIILQSYHGYKALL